MLTPTAPRSRVVKGYRDLLVWQRAAVSVPSNVAEGHGREHLGDYLHHLSVANGSLMELETQLMIAGRLGYLSGETEERILADAAEVGRMLSGLVRALRKRR